MVDIINSCIAGTEGLRSLALYTHLIPMLSILVLGTVVFAHSKDRIKSYFFLGFCLTFSLWLLGNLLNRVSNDYFLVAATWAPLDFINIVFFIFLFLFITSRSEARSVPIAALGVLIASIAYPFWLTVTGRAVFEFYEPVCEMLTNPLISNYKLIIEIIILFATIAVGGYQIYAKRQTAESSKRRQLAVLTLIVLIMAIFAGAEFVSTYTEIYEIHLYALLTLPPFVLVLSILVTTHEKLNIGDMSLKVLFFLFLIISASQFMFVESRSDLIVLSISYLMAIGFGIMLFKISEREKMAREQVERLADNLKRTNERLTELDKLKTEFVSIASHQMRSPLTAITGFSSLILEGSYGPTSRDVKEAISKILRSSKSMSVAVDDFLNVTRIEQGKINIDKTAFDLKDLVDATCDEYYLVAQQHGLTLNGQTGSAPIEVYGDRDKIKQILNNLIDNALKYTKQGSVTIALEHTSLGCATLSISDTGVGIPEADKDHIFEKFTRARNANTVTVQGTGLGLYIVKHLVTLHHGKIWFESEAGKGTTFFVSLPTTHNNAEVDHASAKTVNFMKVKG